MIALTIGNSYSIIKGLSPAAEKALQKELSYEVDPQAAYYGGRFGSKRKSLLDRQGSFPSGLVARVEAYIAKLNLGPITRFDSRSRPITGSVSLKPDFNGIQPYDDQVKAADAAVAFRHSCISMPTGSGKSMVMALVIAKLQVKTLIVVPTLEIKRQLSAGLERTFGKTKHIRVENIGAAALKKATDYDMLIIDECHHSASKTYGKLNKTAWQGIYYRLFLTATPFRTQAEEMLLYEGIAGPVRFKLSYSEAVAKKYIVPVEAYYLEVPKQQTNAVSWAEVYREHVVRNNPRNEMIAALLHQLGDASTLCLVKEIEHGEILSEMAGLPFVNGQDEDSRRYIEQFNSGAIKQLIGTTGVLGEGIDTKPAEFIIVAGLGKAKSSFMQSVGRGVRQYPGKESAKIVIIKDRSHKFTLRHFNTQAKILKEEYGVVPSKLDV